MRELNPFLITAKINKDEVVGHLEENEVLRTSVDSPENSVAVRQTQQRREPSHDMSESLPPHVRVLYENSSKGKTKQEQKVIKDELVNVTDTCSMNKNN